MGGGAAGAAAAVPEIWVMDGNVIINIAEGNGPAAEALLHRQRSGARVYIARAAYNEVITGAATPEIARQYDALMRDAKIHVAPEPTDPKVRAQQLTDRVKFYEDNWEHAEKFERNQAKPPKKRNHQMVGAVDEYGAGVHASRPGDAYVAAETKSLKGRRWTFDAKTRKRAANLGVEIAPESTSVASIEGGRGNVDINRARRSLGIPEEPARVEMPTSEARLNAAARPTAAKRMGLRLTARVNGRAIVSFGAAALQFAAAIGMHFLERWMMKRMLEDKLKKGLEAAHATINSAVVALVPEIAKRQLKWYGWEKMFVLVHLEVHNVKRSLGPGRASYQDVEVKLVNISLGQDEYKREWTYDVPGGEADARIYAFEVSVYTKEEIDAFRKLAEQRNSNEIRLARNPNDDIFKKRKEFIRQDIIQGFGREVLDMEENYKPIMAESVGMPGSAR